MFAEVSAIILALFAGALVAQSVFNLYVTLYAWDNPERMKRARAPRKFAKPKHGFSVLLPCRNEEEVIGETIRALSEANYPKRKFELLVICTPDDPGTIEAAKASIRRHKIRNAKVIVFDLPAGKSRGMNIGLSQAKHDLVTIFDSEDDVSPDIFNIANTLFVERDVDVLQCGVQLMDHGSRWFSALNVLEYFFWFKSRMHFHAKMGIVPLGGNTVFFRKSDLQEVGGWDEHGLTEDADLGIRLSILGKKFDVMYDAAHVTREETPPTVKAFVKQRTRWNQGFLQILSKKDWRRLPGLMQQALILYVLISPAFMSLVIVCSPFLVLAGLLFGASVLISLLTFVPLFLTLLAILTSLIGLYEFGRDQNIKIKWYSYIYLVLSFLPYQALLATAGARALVRELLGSRGWEKTAHVGAHRNTQSEQETQPAAATASTSVSANEETAA